MDEGGESSLIYQLGVSEEKCSVLSLKANSRLLKALQDEDSGAWIEFTSTTSARVTIGNEEYDLSFCDTKPTDAYIQEDWIQMGRLGEVQGRLQVTNSRSGGAKESAVSATVEKLNLYPELDSKKREISLLDIGTGLSNTASLTSQRLPESNKKPKLAHTSTSIPNTPSTTTPRRKPTSYSSAEITQIPLAQPSFDLTSPTLLLGNIPVEVAASDVLSTLFSGLSIAAMYVCSRAPQDVLTHTDSGYSVSHSATVDLYVEFNFIRGAELAMIRDGEELSYRSLTTNTTSSTSTTTPKPAFTRKQVAPILQPVDQQLAFWVRAVGIKLCTTNISAGTSNGGGASHGLTLNTPIKRYIEALADTFLTTANTTTSTATLNATTHTTYIADILSDPVSLARHWWDVTSQLLLPSGCIDAHSTDYTQKVRIFKDTKYLYRNPAVDDILLAHLSNSSSDISVGNTTIADNNSGVGFLCDAGGDGLYSVEDDVAHTTYEHFAQEAEACMTHYSTLWYALNLSNSSISSNISGDGNNKFVLNFVRTRLSLYKAMYKQAWGLSTTYSVFK